MANPTDEFNHVSQFYETILGMSFLLMFVSLFLALCKGSLDDIRQQREYEDDHYIDWVEK
jgi:hypothetical protein